MADGNVRGKKSELAGRILLLRVHHQHDTEKREIERGRRRKRERERGEERGEREREERVGERERVHLCLVSSLVQCHLALSLARHPWPVDARRDALRH